MANEDFEETIENQNLNTKDNDVDINFAQIKLLRDALGSPIPQFWDMEKSKWVPITNMSMGAGSPAVIPIATAEILGGIKPDFETLIVDADTGIASVLQKVHISNRDPLPTEGRDGDIWKKYVEVE